jgi:uncharacterized protein YkwD
MSVTVHRAILLSLLAAASAAPAATQDLVDTLNALRAQGCDGRPGAKPALRHDPRLDQVGASLARGQSLKDALLAAGYRATEVAVLEAAGEPAAVGRALAEKGCADILGPAWRDVGVATPGPKAWIVLAAPLEAPAATAAAVTARVLELVNAARGERRRCGLRRLGPAPPLAASAALVRAAAAHSADMASRGVMDHAGGDGSTPAERATRAGYAWRTVGENVAQGQSSPEQVVDEWLGSPRHCANIMDPDFSEMGVAVASSPQGVFWAQVFGAPAP